MGDGLLLKHIFSNAAERIVRLRNSIGPILAGVKIMEFSGLFISLIFLCVKLIVFIIAESPYTLVDEGDNARQVKVGKLLPELLGIAAVDFAGTRCEIGKSPYRKHGSGCRPCEHGKAHPLQELAEVVG